ncbi:hypothetical protein VTK56DRAFT_6821 [Thermocarpiscus australiensis]
MGGSKCRACIEGIPGCTRPISWSRQRSDRSTPWSGTYWSNEAAGSHTRPGGDGITTQHPTALCELSQAEVCYMAPGDFVPGPFQKRHGCCVLFG